MKRIHSRVAWEKAIAYSRATKVDDHICMSGTTAVDKA